jgi:hypothetical protein
MPRIESKDRDLGRQLRRAVTSIVLNIGVDLKAIHRSPPLHPPAPAFAYQLAAVSATQGEYT